MDVALLQQLAIALGLGLLVGLQREWAAKEIAGIRTFPLITAFGTLSGTLAQHAGGWILAAALASVATMIAVGNLAKVRRGDTDPGITTEIAALLMFGVGAALAYGYIVGGVTVAGAVAVLLQSKQPLHNFVAKIGEGELREIIRLVLIGLVILPLLPNREFGPYHVINPFKIWLMVVLIVGISLAAYLLSRMLGPKPGSILAGVLGGLISSTATTVAYSRRSRADGRLVTTGTIVIITASAVVFARAIFEILLVAPGIATRTLPPLIAMGLWVSAIAVASFVFLGRGTASSEEHPPSDFKAAVAFGALYAVVLLLVAVADEHLGRESLYLVAGLSGLTDMDAITLSTAQLVDTGRLDGSVGWRLILTGALANLVFKGAVVATLGPAALRARVLVAFGLAVAGGGALLLWWPA